DYPEDSTVEFVFISRIMKEKGIDQYLDAAKHIRGKYPNTRFHILGFSEEDYEKELKSLQDQDIITYHGMQRDVRKFLKNFHCTVHPSFHEGMSNVLLESAASGVPIITTNTRGIEEMIEKIEKFLTLLYDEKKEMGLAGRRKVEREFDREIVVEAYMKEINRLK